MLIRVYILLGIVLHGSCTYGQYPDFNPYPNNFINTPTIFNPSAENEKLLLDLTYRSKVGLFDDVKNYYVGFLVPVGKHSVGMKAYSETETSYFTKSKALANYAYQIVIDSTVFWNLATQLGVANITFGSSGASAGGSDTNFDLSFGTEIRFSDMQFGLVAHQLSNSVLSPINYSFHLDRYVETYILYRFIVNHYWDIRVGYKYLYQIASFHDLCLRAEYNSKVGVLMALTSDGASLGFFLNILIGKSINQLSILYKAPVGLKYFNKSNELQVGLRIYHNQ